MGGSGFLCPQAWLERCWAEAVGAGEPCHSLPPPPLVPARRVPFSFSTPCFPRLLTITPSLQALSFLSP